MHDPQQTLSSLSSLGPLTGLGPFAGFTPFTGAANPFGSPYAALQTTVNPYTQNPVGFNPTGWNPLAINPLAALAQTGVGSPYGQQNPFGIQQQVPNYAAVQQLQQIASILAQQGLGQQGMAQQPFGIPVQQNPWQHQLAAQQNQIVAAILQNPVLAQQLALQAVAQQYGQQQGGQTQYGQSWQMHPQIGQQQSGLAYGQVPHGQTGIQSGFGQPAYQLAPQSWVGQAGAAQFGGRGIY